jgi:hypothetical protein
MTVPEAIDIAKRHLVSTLPEFSETSPQLEELETPPSGSKWKFTFSGSFPVSPDASLAQLLRGRRVSKLVEIDPETGDLLAVRNTAA